jgi:hypothetical protein
MKYIKRNDKVKKKNNKGYYKEDYKRDNDKSKNENNNRKMIKENDVYLKFEVYECTVGGM